MIWGAPSALYGLFFLPILLLLPYRLEKWRQSVHQTISPSKQRFRSDTWVWARSLSLCVIWFFAVLALAQPQGNPRLVSSPTTHKTYPEDLLFVLDVSQSMQVADTRSGASRLNAALDLLREILPRFSGHRMSLWFLSDQVVTVVPPTTDLFYLLFTIDQLQKQEAPGGGTDFSRLFEKVLEWEETVDKGRIFLFSDGEDTSPSEVSPLKGSNIPFTVVGMGSAMGGEVPGVLFDGKPVTSSLQTRFLQELARTTKGEYLSENEPSSLIVKAVVSEGQEQKIVGQQPVLETTPLFYLPLLLALLFFIPFLFSREKRVALAVALFLPFSCSANEATLEFYQSALTEDRPRWQDDVILYNLGTLYLQKQNPAKAVEAFEKIPAETLPVPTFQQRLEKNRTIAYLMLAKKLRRSAPTADSLLPLEKAFGLLLRAEETGQFKEAVNRELETVSRALQQEEQSLLEKGWHQRPISQSIFDELAKEQRQPVSRLLEKSEEAAKADDEATARFLYGAAMIRFIDLQRPHENDPYKILENLVKKQQMVYRLGQRTRTPEQKQFLKALENEVLADAGSFPKAVMSLQQRQYQEKGCVNDPWERIYPLFIRGYEALLRGDRESAWEEWQNALLAWFSPPPPVQKEQEKWNELIQPLQRMQAQDQTSLTIQPTRGTGGRQW